ncbi:LOW QUALITY PROTEIN: cytochrome P450 [Colletotrichum navitas]|uniref:Cytochrome P450 n=1 Tax=Colletotrichum navitas TaxID=681940 RepID=A0AAD8PKV9_9PEZI|nr:LOW QUALITY PROTEIN: cytochrome P450 [Colletotrichum navitas]KAK1566050.1 LOW QUALITY PROTEIN: cytochrome P450 [Colletotrichum navitas]
MILFSTLGFVVFYVLGRLLYNVYFHPLCRYPGPKLWAATRIPYTQSMVTGRLHRRVLELHQEYGPIVRIGPDELAYNDSKAWRDLHGHVKGQTGDHGRDPVATWDYRHGIIGAKREDHPRFRRGLTHGFSAQAMKEQQPIVTGYVDLFIQRLHQSCASGSRPLDMVKWYDFVTFDILGDLAFGESFNCLQGSEYHSWVKIIFDNVKASAIGIEARRFPAVARLLEYLVPAHLIEQQKHHNALTHHKRLAAKGERPDFMHSMLRKRENKTEFTLPELESTSSTIIMAGSETTSTALAGITYFLVTHPEVMKKLCNEVRASFATEDEINMNSVQSLRYMYAIINEGMRMFPPVATGIPRKVFEGGGVFLDRFVPEGTLVQVWHWSVYHSPGNFAFPDSFVPERWLDEDARFANDRKEAFQPFSIGPRSCIGMNLAYAEMRLILARVIWNFDIKLHPDSRGWFEGMKTYILWQKDPLQVYLTPRKVGDGSRTFQSPPDM